MTTLTIGDLVGLVVTTAIVTSLIWAAFLLQSCIVSAFAGAGVVIVVCWVGGLPDTSPVAPPLRNAPTIEESKP